MKVLSVTPLHNASLDFRKPAHTHKTMKKGSHMYTGLKHIYVLTNMNRCGPLHYGSSVGRF